MKIYLVKIFDAELFGSSDSLASMKYVTKKPKRMGILIRCADNVLALQDHPLAMLQCNHGSAASGAVYDDALACQALAMTPDYLAMVAGLFPIMTDGEFLSSERSQGDLSADFAIP